MSFDPQSLVGTPIGEFRITGLLSTEGPVLRYQAVHQQLRRTATCHVLHPDQAATLGELFLRRVRLISQVRQRNLIDIFDSGTVGSNPYFLSEALPGQPLSTWLARHHLGVDKLREIVQQLGQALTALHGTQVTLTHLAPEDIYVQRRGLTLSVLLVGFFESGTSPTVPAAMQAQSMATVARFVYGLCLAKPFANPLPPLSGETPLLPAGVALSGLGNALDPVLRRALTANPEQQFTSLSELFSALLAAIPKQATGTVKSLLQRAWWVGPALLLLVIGGWSLRRLLHKPPTPTTTVERTYTVRELHELAKTTLQAGLRSSDATVREQALSGLLRSSDVSWRSLVEPLLDDPAPAVQLRAAEVLGSLGARRAIPSLQVHLRTDFDPALRTACARALHRLGEPLTRKSLGLLLSGENPHLRLQAAQILAAQGDAEAAKTVAEFQKQNSDEGLDALSWLAQRGDGSAQDQLRGLLPTKPPLPARLLGPAEVLLRQEVPQARGLLVETAKQPGPSQLAAAQVLCSVDDPSFLPLLRTALSSPAQKLEQRRVAALGLQSCGERSDGKLLARVLEDQRESPLLRQASAGALLRLTSLDPELLASQGVAWAQQALDDDNWSVRESAVALLGESVPTLPTVSKRTEVAKPVAILSQVVELLRRALQDPQQQVRIAALRSAVKLTQKAGEPSLRENIRKSLRQRLGQGSAEEQLLVATSLLRTGDGSGRDLLYKGLRSPDLSLRRRAVEEADADPKLPTKLLTPLLSDRDFAVRFGAAVLLVAQGQKQAPLLAILREAVQRGGTEGVRAYSLLQKLGALSTTDASKGPDLATLLASSDVLQRLMAIDELQKLPMAEAVPLLLKATRDPDATVRFRLVDVVAHHCDGKQRAALPALRTLSEDTDIAVRARATAVLGQLQLPELEVPPPVQSDEKATANSTTKVDSKEAESAQPAQNPVAEVETPLPSQDARASQAIEQQFAVGNNLFKQGNYRAAQKALEKTSQMCAAHRSDVPRCTQLNGNLAYQLGVVYENLGQLANAMTEYQKVLQGAGAARGPAKRPQARAGLALHDAAQQGFERLRGKLGRLVLYKTIAGKCQKVEVYMPPGKHQVSVGGGQRKPVDLDAGESVELKTCP